MYIFQCKNLIIDFNNTNFASDSIITLDMNIDFLIKFIISQNQILFAK